MTNAALYIRKLRKLPHAHQTSYDDMIEVIDLDARRREMWRNM